MWADYPGLMMPWHTQVGRGPAPETELPADYDFALAHRQAQVSLASEIIARIHALPPVFFETLVIDVLLAMGYGSRGRDLARHLGCVGDGGIDGLIAVDELGLDIIYIQAKRLKPGTVVPVGEVRDFTGSLDAHQASKGIFVTTSHFSGAANDFVRRVSRRVVLVDGNRLSDLMIRHNIGVRVSESYQIKRIDTDYFSAEPGSKRKLDTMPASIQPRR